MMRFAATPQISGGGPILTIFPMISKIGPAIMDAHTHFESNLPLKNNARLSGTKMTVPRSPMERNPRSFISVPGRLTAIIAAQSRMVTIVVRIAIRWRFPSRYFLFRLPKISLTKIVEAPSTSPPAPVTTVIISAPSPSPPISGFI